MSLSEGVEFDPAQLEVALEAMPQTAWSLPSEYMVTGVHHGYRRLTLVDGGHRWPQSEPFAFVLDALGPVWAAWLSWIDPGGFIVPHRDAGPWRERWQVPIQPAGTFHSDEASEPVAGRAFRVVHWRAHSVVNDTSRPRVHIVLDRSVWLDLPAAPFTLYPIPDHMAEIVRRSLHGVA